MANLDQTLITYFGLKRVFKSLRIGNQMTFPVFKKFTPCLRWQYNELHFLLVTLTFAIVTILCFICSQPPAPVT